MWLELADIFWFSLLATGCYAWWHNLKRRESATRAVRQYCRREEVQLLDESIALEKIRLARDPDLGRLVLIRQYQFYFTSTGDERYSGKVSMHGRHLQQIELAPHRLS